MGHTNAFTLIVLANKSNSRS